MRLQLNTRLKRILKENDITVAQLSRATKIPPQTLNNWLSGQEPRKLSQVKTVAEYFEMSLDELLYGDTLISQKNITSKNPLNDFSDEINAGVFEVVLRRIKK